MNGRETPAIPHRITLLTVCTIPGNQVLYASNYSSAETLSADILDRMSMPGFESVIVTKRSKETLLDNLKELHGMSDDGEAVAH